jgi:hypothetical protein
MIRLHSRPPWRWHAGAFVIYALAAVVFIDHGVSLAGNVLGRGNDPYGFVWFLAWWPFAVLHHLDPFWTNLIWQPGGYALLWGSSVPLLAMLMAPVTLTAGPVVSFNLLVLAAPVLSAFCAYLLCLRITRAPAAAVAGGYLFGFATYQMAQASVLNMCFTFLLPCLVWVCLARVAEKIGRRRCVVLFCLVLPCEFLISTEIFAMMVVFGAIIWLLAFVMVPERRPGLRRLLMDGLIAAPIVALLLSPFLAAMFSHYPFVNLPAFWPYFFVADLFAAAVPSGNSLLGGQLLHGIIEGFYGDLQEQDSYLGLPLLLIVYGFARTQWRAREARFLVAALLILLLASLGPDLWAAGFPSGILLPWAAFIRLPLLGGALPVRFALFAALAAAIIAALWIAAAAPGRNRNIRLLAAGVACLALLPVPGPHQKLPVAKFFAPGRVAQVLGPAARVMILPFSIHGPSSFWQVESQFSFAQTGGYLGFPPAAAQQYPAVQEMFGGDPAAVQPADLENFVTATNTQYILAGPGTSAGMFAILAQLHWKMQQTDDVTIYTVPAPSDAHG